MLPTLTRRVLSRLLLAVAAGLCLSAGSAPADDAPLKIGFVYVGPVGDAGWTYAHDQGRRAIEQAYGARVQTSYVESVAEGADAERVIRQLAMDGHQLIFTTSFGYMQATLKVARQFPKVKFEHATGYSRAANVGTYEARFYEGAYLLGVVAGSMSKTGTLGYVASFPIPEVLRNINAFTLGAQSVNPAIRTKVIWVNTWYDPGKERQAAETLIAQGADALCQNTDSPATLQVAEQKGVYACGWDSDMARFAPKAQYSANVINWAPYYLDTVAQVLDGSWTSREIKHGIAEGMVQLAPLLAAVPPAGVKAFAAKKQAIIDGSFTPFQGPLHDQSGALRLADGERLPVKELMSMNWYVKGVDGVLPR